MMSETLNALDDADFVHTVLIPLVRGTDLERREAHWALREIFEGRVEDLHVASFLTALTAKGETAQEMTGFIDAMVESALTFDVEQDAVDVVGTGGDQLHTVNVSTMASFAVAGCGVPVAKHGNRAASSSVGSADVLEALGVRLDTTPDVVRDCVRRAGIGFCYAPTFHPKLGRLAPIRRSLGFRTIFNVLGPLANPARVRRSVIGVAQEHLLSPMADVLAARGVDYAILVRGDDGLDELSLGTSSTLHVVTANSRHVETLNAADVLGVRWDAASLRGGDVDHNVRVVRDVLAGVPGPAFDVVCANAALALRVAGRCETLSEGFVQAQDSLVSGRAAAALATLVEVSNS